MKSRFPIVELGKHVRQVSQRNRTKADVEVFSVTNSEGFTKSTDYFNKEVFSKDVSNYKVVSPGQFAYNPSRINVGSIDYLRHENAVLVSPLYIVFEGNKDLHADYLLRYLKSGWGNSQIRANTEGAVRDSLKFKGLESINLPLPPLDDQIRIAHLLGKVEGLITQRKQHLKQLDDLLKSVFLEMFGDPVRNEKGWDIVYWDDLFVTRTGKLNANAMSENGAYPFFTCAKEIFHIDSFAFDCEALILAGNNATGDYDVKYYKGKFNAYQRTYILELKADADEYSFFKHHLEMKLRQLKDGSKGANTRYLTKQFLDTIAFIQPSVDGQKTFSTVSRKVEALKSSYQQSLTDLEDLYGALSQQAFKGELDLSRVPLPEIRSVPEKIPTTPAPEATNPDLALPEPKTLVEILKDTEARKKLLHSLLITYREQLGNQPLSAQHFMEAIELRLLRQLDTATFDLLDNLELDKLAVGLQDYEQVKEWVFAELAAGRLVQALDDAGNRIQLKAMQHA